MHGQGSNTSGTACLCMGTARTPWTWQVLHEECDDGGYPFKLSRLILAGHNYIGHNYIGHNYTGHHIGHSYAGHDYLGHNYIGHNYVCHNYVCHKGSHKLSQLVVAGALSVLMVEAVLQLLQEERDARKDEMPRFDGLPPLKQTGASALKRGPKPDLEMTVAEETWTQCGKEGPESIGQGAKTEIGEVPESTDQPVEPQVGDLERMVSVKSVSRAKSLKKETEEKGEKRQFRLNIKLSFVVSNICLGMIAAHAIVVKESIRFLHCESTESGRKLATGPTTIKEIISSNNETIMEEHPTMCWTGDHTSIGVLSVLALVLFCIGFPAVSGWQVLLAMTAALSPLPPSAGAIKLALLQYRTR